MDDYPVIAQADGIKLKPEKMEVEKLYHCIFEGKVFLFYKDEEQMLHCYEVEDPTVVKEILEKPSNIESILQKHALS
jgi:hypothetical protein